MKQYLQNKLVFVVALDLNEANNNAYFQKLLEFG